MDLVLTPGESLAQWLDRAALQLATGSHSARLDAELLLAHLLRRRRSQLLAHAEERHGAPLAQVYAQLIARRAHGEPLAYITGEREFWSLPLTVTPDVLIPRPETELAVERCLALVAGNAADVADLGTGCGAIALALARDRPRWRITATDISAAALSIAAANAQRLEVNNVEFVHGCWLAPLVGRKFALIVSNPPYVADDHAALRDPALRHEPRVALTPGATGFEALNEILAAARACLKDGGWLVLEHGADQAAELAKRLVAHGYARVRCHSDLAGLDRVTEARRL